MQPLLRWKSSKHCMFWEWDLANLSCVACLALQLFPQISHKKQNFQKETLFYLNCLFWFLLQHFSETFLILMVSERGMIKKNYWSSSKIPVIIWKKIEFLDRFKKKHSNIKFHENPSSGSRVVSYGRTDGRTERHMLRM